MATKVMLFLKKILSDLLDFDIPDCSCRNCLYLYKCHEDDSEYSVFDECHHPNNTETYRNYKTLEKGYKRIPTRINYNNKCNWFKSKEVYYYDYHGN